MRFVDLTAPVPDATAKKGLNSVAATVFICLAYLIAERFALPLALPVGSVSAVIPASGIAVCAVYLMGPRALIGIALAAFAVNLWVAFSSLGASLSIYISALTIASASIVQGAIGGLVLRRVIGYPCTFDSVREITLFGAITPLFCLIGASISIPILCIIHGYDFVQARQAWLVWWLGDTLGVLLTMPILLTLFGEPRPIWRRRRVTIALPMLVAAVLIVLAFMQAARWEELESLNYLRTQIGWQSWSILVVGLFATALLGAFLLLSSGYTARVELEVQQKMTQLRESDERWQFALEGAGDGVWDIDVERGSMFLSPQNMAMLGYPREPCYLVTSEWKKYLHPDDLQRTRGILRRCIEQGESSYVFEFRALTKDGQWRWLRRRAKLFGKLPTGFPARMVGTHTNIDLEKTQEFKDHLRGIAMEMLAKKHSLSEIVNAIIKKLHSNDRDFIYAAFVQRQNQLINVSANRFNAELRAHIFPWNDSAKSCGKGIRYDEIVDVSTADNELWQSFDAFAREVGVTLYWVEPFSDQNGSTAGALVIFKIKSQSRTLPKIDYIKLAAELFDLTLQHKLIEEQTQLIASVYDAISEAIVVGDEEGRIVMVNPAFTTITGYSAEEIIGQVSELLRYSSEVIKLDSDSNGIKKERGSSKGEMWIHRKNSEMFPAEITINTIWDYSGKAIRRVAIFSDITERKINEERVQYLATHDPLTSLPNRILFQDRTQRVLAAAQRDNKKFGLLYIDLDHFKPINDTFGHSIGDQLLRAVAVRMKSCVREVDTVARIGGDEFVVLLPDIKTPTDIFAVAEKMIQKLSDEFEISENVIKISASIGIAVYPEDGSDENELFKNADAAMYLAKQQGRNNIKAHRVNGWD